MDPCQAEAGQSRLPRPSSFQFVNFRNLHDMRDAENLSRIRKHAMHDIGVTRRRRSNYKRRSQIKIPLEVLTELDIPLPSPANMVVGHGAIDPFMQFPITLDDFGRELVVNSRCTPHVLAHTSYREAMSE